MNVRCHAPCRVDLAGGTLDIWPRDLLHDGAVTMNFAVDREAATVLPVKVSRQGVRVRVST
jgi:hypothetical protein